jgi:hypothetical protein
MLTIEQGWNLVVVFGIITFVVTVIIIARFYWDKM